MKEKNLLSARWLPFCVSLSRSSNDNNGLFELPEVTENIEVTDCLSARRDVGLGRLDAASGSYKDCGINHCKGHCIPWM